MKNLTKIFMAVVAGMFAFSCVTDTTEDLGVKLEGAHKGQGTTLTLSMPEATKTHLGAKVDNLYPLYWSDGDAILLNGNASNPLEGVAENATTATFSFKTEDIAYPFCVVYPAPETKTDGEATDGEEVVEPTAPASVYPVNFLATQKYTVDTFAPQAAPMYTYVVEAAEGEEQEKIVMKHLTGVLRLAVKGNGEKLTALTVSASEGKIAGPHTIDCATGELVALEEAGSTVTVVLPEEGLVLGAEATPIYVTVPAGKHGVYTVTLVSDALEENTMVVKFNSDFHPVTAGVVKEFGEFTFTPNANNAEEGELVIVNAAQLKRLAQLSEIEQLGNVTKVTIGATIDLSEVAWTPINLLPSHIVFDGGADQGFSIKGLKAPLFNSTAATIQNLSLTDVAIVETADVKVGAIARSFYGTMKSCVAAGTLEMNNTTFTTTANMEKYDVINIGGLVGQAGNATFEQCENRVNITVNSVSAVEQGGESVAVGGIVAAAHSQSSFDNTDNYGQIEICGGILVNNMDVGGILGHMINVGTTTPEVATIKNCDNHGELFMNNQILAEGNNATVLHIGGISGNLLSGVDFNNNNNHAEIHNDGYCAATLLAGIVGYRNLSAVVSCNNNANIYNTGRHSFLEMGGIVAEDTYAAITNCKNNAEKLYNTATKAANAVTDNANVYIGGITGSNEAAKVDGVAIDAAENAISGCYNYAVIEHTGDAKAIFLGGISARSSAVDMNNCHNSGAIKHIGYSTGNCYVSGIAGISCHSLSSTTNTGAIVLGTDSKFPAATSTVRVSGLANTVNGGMSECTNSGALTINGTHDVTLTGLQVAGLAYYTYGNVSNCENNANADITLNNVKTADIHLAGLVTTPYITGDNTEDFENNYNRGDITLNNCACTATANTNCRIAGLVALTASTTNYGELTSDNQVAWKNCANYGNINLNDFQPGPYSTTKYGRTMVGGCFCTYYTGQFDLDNCDNHGEVKLNRLVSNCNLFIGGVIAYWGASSAISNIDAYIKDCDNTKTVRVNTSAPATEQTGSGEGFMVGGVIAASYMNTDFGQSLTLTNLTNSGDVIVDGNYVSKNASRNSIGGVSGDYYTYGTLTNCHNTGDVKFTPDATSKSTNTHTYIGGVLGYNYPYVQNKGTNLTYCTNTGAVEVVNLKMNSSKYLFVGGVLGYEKSRTNIYTYNNCGNSGDVLVDNVTSASYVYVGGMYGYLEQGKASGKDTVFEGEQVNIGNLTVKNCALTGTTMIGGIVGKGVTVLTGAKSYCDIHAIGLQGKVGMIMGIPYAAATMATNCGIAGNLIFSQEDGDSGTDDDGNPTGGGKVDVKTPITEDNYLSYIYTAAVTEANGCTCLSSKPALPVYTPAE